MATSLAQCGSSPTLFGAGAPALKNGYGELNRSPRGRIPAAQASFFDGASDFGGSQALPGSRSPSRESARGLRRTSSSARMQSGDDVRQALTHCPEPLLRRMTSMPPRLFRAADDDSSVVSWSLATPRSNETSSLTARAPVSSQRSTTGDGYARSSRSILDDLRAKPHRRMSVGSRSDAGSMRSQSLSPRTLEDHLWRELFHEEVEERKNDRLRGAGKVLGNRGKSSVGMPWRQIPVYDRAGNICETGDPYYAEHTRRAVPMSFKKTGQFSPKNTGYAYGVKDILTPVSEHKQHRENLPPQLADAQKQPPAAAESNAREEWLALVKRRCEANRGRPAPDSASSHRGRNGYTPSVVSAGTTSPGSIGTASPAAGMPTHYPAPPSSVRGGVSPRPSPRSELDGEAADSQSNRNLHWSYRQQRRRHSTGGMIYAQESCPYPREDTNPEGKKTQPCTTNKRSVVAPPGHVAGVGCIPNASTKAGVRDDVSEASGFAAERVAEARRDWQFANDKAMVYDGPVNDPVLMKSATARSLQTNGMSERAASPEASPTQAMRVRTSTQRPRWK